MRQRSMRYHIRAGQKLIVGPQLLSPDPSRVLRIACSLQNISLFRAVDGSPVFSPHLPELTPLGGPAHDAGELPVNSEAPRIDSEES